MCKFVLHCCPSESTRLDPAQCVCVCTEKNARYGCPSISFGAKRQLYGPQRVLCCSSVSLSMSMLLLSVWTLHAGMRIYAESSHSYIVYPDGKRGWLKWMTMTEYVRLCRKSAIRNGVYPFSTHAHTLCVCMFVCALNYTFEIINEHNKWMLNHASRKG